METGKFRASNDRVELARLLATLEVGDEITYDTLSQAIGRDVQNDGRSVLERARYTLERDQRRVFGVMLGLGLRRLNDREIVATSDRVRAHIRRSARKGARTVLCAEYEALPREDQTKHNVALSIFGLLEQMTGDKAYKRIQTGVKETGRELPGMAVAVLALKDVS